MQLGISNWRHTMNLSAALIPSSSRCFQLTFTQPLHTPKGKIILWGRGLLVNINIQMQLYEKVDPIVNVECKIHFRCYLAASEHWLRTPNEDFFHWSSEILGLGRQTGQTNWAEKFWGISGIIGLTISTLFGAVSSLSKSMFSIIQPLFLRKTNPLYPLSKYLFWIRNWIWAGKN